MEMPLERAGRWLAALTESDFFAEDEKRRRWRVVCEGAGPLLYRRAAGEAEAGDDEGRPSLLRHAQARPPRPATLPVRPETDTAVRTFANLKCIGAGAHGKVYKSFVYWSDASRAPEVCALKESSTEAFSRQSAARELARVRKLRPHRHLVHIMASFAVRNAAGGASHCLVMPLAAGTLTAKLDHYLADPAGMLLQLHSALLYVHSRRVVHLDVKPCNVLVYGDCHLRLADFGSSLLEGEPFSTEHYECSRFYRAPEIMFGAAEARRSMDHWSLGAVAAELALQRQPLFRGKTGLEQLRIVVASLGPPSAEELRSMIGKRVEQLAETARAERDHFWRAKRVRALEPRALAAAEALLVYDISERNEAFRLLPLSLA